MCGIAGKVYLEPHRGVEPDALAAMCQALVHRGPDDYGVHLDGNVGLAMRRLAVIDVDTGRQPIHNEDRSVWTVYNGEIYNFAELQRELEARGHRFYTRTDTEVIVHLYEEQGLDFVRSLNGMFTIALWDAARRRLVLARDRLGIKPLYVAQLPDRLLFGSEIKALLADGLRPTVDVEALSLYLSLLYIPAPHTIYREIRKLEPGHLLVWQGGRLTDHRYWDLAEIRPAARDLRPAAVSAQLLDLLTDAVRRQLVSDVPLGVFLSGGLDSSTVVALTRRVHSGAVKTFSIGFDDPSYDERAAARLIARRFETDHTELTITPDVADLVPKLVSHFDEPFADASAIPTYYLSQLTRRHYDEVPHHDPLNRFLYADTRVYLPDDILVKVDRMSMAHSLEVRVPLLDHRVVEFMFRLPGVLKMPGLALKHVLKRTMRGLLPDETLRKRKGGFNVPMSAWLKQQLRPLVDEYLSPARVRRDGFFRPETTSRLVVEHMTGRADYSRNLWALLLFGVWLEQAPTSGASAATSAIAAGLTPSFALCAPATGVLRG